jgi:hypothetical protein
MNSMWRSGGPSRRAVLWSVVIVRVPGTVSSSRSRAPIAAPLLLKRKRRGHAARSGGRGAGARRATASSSLKAGPRPRVAVGAPETGPPRSRRAPSRGMQSRQAGAFRVPAYPGGAVAPCGRSPDNPRIIGRRALGLAGTRACRWRARQGRAPVIRPARSLKDTASRPPGARASLCSGPRRHRGALLT